MTAPTEAEKAAAAQALRVLNTKGVKSTPKIPTVAGATAPSMGQHAHNILGSPDPAQSAKAPVPGWDVTKSPMIGPGL